MSCRLIWAATSVIVICISAEFLVFKLIFLKSVIELSHFGIKVLQKLELKWCFGSVLYK